MLEEASPPDNNVRSFFLGRDGDKIFAMFFCISYLFIILSSCPKPGGAVVASVRAVLPLVRSILFPFQVGYNGTSVCLAAACMG